MARSGGGLPRFESVKIEGLAAARAAAVAGPKLPETMKASKSWAFVVAIIAVILLGAAGYLVFATFFGGGGTAVPQRAPRPENSSQNGLSGGAVRSSGSGLGAGASAATATAPAAPPGPASFTHQSLFRKPADQVLVLALNTTGGASTAADLETFNQKLQTLLAAANKAATLIEIEVKDASGKDMSIGDILAAANETVIDPAALAQHFNSDATFFVYRDKNGFWPGYVLVLRSGDNWLFSSADVAKLETSPSIANFFLENVGAPSPDGFTDSTISGVAVRVLPYLNAPVPAYFVYGWTKGELVLGASQGGFSAAVSRL